MLGDWLGGCFIDSCMLGGIFDCCEEYEGIFFSFLEVGFS